ncbi:YifB family Mg chelatase-like AAA ATPase [Nocardia sp. CA-107356]|uniref:YifB family Mg chelatase-like AAA ATPase n=1 Tax=Nocardia sp. CA-107356 TaxID=3239972 RepID=UPI003D91140D
MASARTYSIAVTGIDGHLVEIEADIGQGLSSVNTTAGPYAALHEARGRVHAAIANTAGAACPDGRIVLALSPPTPLKVGGVHDLALAAAILAAASAVPSRRLASTVLLGELALDGRLRPVRGILPAVQAARDAGFSTVVVPQATLAEAGLATGVDVFGACDLRAVLDWLRGEGVLLEPATATAPDTVGNYGDLSEVPGHNEARWAMEVAAAGGHALRLSGPEGVGKVMLAQHLSGLLPPLTESESLQVTAIHSMAGTLPDTKAQITEPLYVTAHHSTSVAALIGGGVSARPGAISRAHLGVLHLDFYQEFNATVLEALRNPLEDGEVRIARRDGVIRYPAQILLVLTGSVCPCDAARDTDCTCSPLTLRRHRARLRGPVADRIDLSVRMFPQDRSSFSDVAAESSAVVRERVAAARVAAASRWHDESATTNSQVPTRALRQFPLSQKAIEPIKSALRLGQISPRGAERTIRVAWTICDLRGGERPTVEDLTQALNFRHIAMR